MTEQPNHTTLPDGRALAWDEHGDPVGTPVVYCHGFPACRLEARLIAAAAVRRGVRLIVPDRPGFGSSSPSWGRRISDWPADVAHLLDTLGIERCHVLGMSGGGPYALACGALLGERVEGITLIGALGPLTEPEATHGMSPLARLSFHLARHWPRGQATLFHALARVLRHTPGAMLRFTLETGSAADRAVLERDGVRRVLINTMRGSVRQGARPAIEELRRYIEPWPFPSQEVRMPVRLWHGTADAIVPPAHAHTIAAALASARVGLVAGERHLSLPARRADPILRHLVATDKAPVTRDAAG